MALSIRLDRETEVALRQYLELEDITQSDFVREAIREKLARASPNESTPYRLGESLFGRYASGDSDRSENRKTLIRERLGDKYRR